MSKYLLYFNGENDGDLLIGASLPEWSCYFFIFFKFSKSWNLDGRIRWFPWRDLNPKKPPSLNSDYSAFLGYFPGDVWKSIIEMIGYCNQK